MNTRIRLLLLLERTQDPDLIRLREAIVLRYINRVASQTRKQSRHQAAQHDGPTTGLHSECVALRVGYCDLAA